MLSFAHFEVGRAFQVAGDLDIQGAVVLWDLLVQVNVSVLDHLKGPLVREQGTCTHTQTHFR